MAIAGLLDSFIGVYRAAQDSTDRLGDVDTPSFVGRYRGSLQLPRTGMRDEGPGERSNGTHLLFIQWKADIMDGDIFYVESGPNAGKWYTTASAVFEVNRKSHKELYIKPYVGETPNAQ